MQSYVPLVALGAAGTLMDELTCAVPLLKCCPTGARLAAICIGNGRPCSMPGACLQVLQFEDTQQQVLICKSWDVQVI